MKSGACRSVRTAGDISMVEYAPDNLSRLKCVAITLLTVYLLSRRLAVLQN